MCQKYPGSARRIRGAGGAASRIVYFGARFLWPNTCRLPSGTRKHALESGMRENKIAAIDLSGCRRLRIEDRQYQGAASVLDTNKNALDTGQKSDVVYLHRAQRAWPTDTKTGQGRIERITLRRTAAPTLLLLLLQQRQSREVLPTTCIPIDHLLRCTWMAGDIQYSSRHHVVEGDMVVTKYRRRSRPKRVHPVIKSRDINSPVI
jgi:hypothetical protein